VKLLEVSVSTGVEVPFGNGTVRTGIFKRPVSGRVRVRTLNLEGDRQLDTKAHGGIHRAVYAYPWENYAHWQRELGREDFEVPQFGENLTVSGMLEDVVHVGDVFRIGTARVQVTQPRVPCFRLGIRMGDPAFPKRFLQSCRVGFYLRVLEEGDVGAGDAIELERADPEGMTVREVCHLYYFDPHNTADRQRALRIGSLSPGWREGFEKQLGKAGVADRRADR